jgi:outer membrane protein assembly factor BamB
MRSPSRRDVLAATGGALAGLAGGYVAHPHLDSESPPDPAPLAWADTEWPYPDYDPQRTRNPPPESAPDGDLAEQWRYPASGRRPEVAVANGRAVVRLASTSSPRVASLAVDTGDEQWNAATSGSQAAPVAAPGDRVFAQGRERDTFASLAASDGSTLWTAAGKQDQPFLGGGRQYVLDATDGTVRVRAVNARTGQKLWTTQVSGGYFPAAAYVASADRVVVNTDRTTTCLDATDGTTVWHEEVGGNAFAYGPVVAGSRVFRAAFQSGVTALDAASGDVLWQEPFDSELRNAEDPTVARYFALGAATDSTLLAVERHGDDRPEQLVAVDAATGERRWRTEYDEETSVSRPTIVDGTAYASVGSDQRQELVRFDLADGAQMDAWSLPTYGSAPVVADGWVFVPTNDALLAFA